MPFSVSAETGRESWEANFTENSRYRRARAIGQQVALLANAFGCKVLGYNRSPKALPHITQVDKDTLLRQSDIITVHLPLNPETKAFIGTNEFALMQPHAVLINTARGPIVSQEALYNALKKDK